MAQRNTVSRYLLALLLASGLHGGLAAVPSAAQTTGQSVAGSVNNELQGLVYQMGDTLQSAATVTAVSLKLHNALPEPVTLLRHTLKDAYGRVLLQNTEPVTIEPDDSINWAVGFKEPPPRTSFQRYKVEWEVEYEGGTYLKVKKVIDSEGVVTESR